MEIFLTKRANSKLIEIQDRIRNEWGDNVAKAFEDRVNGFLKSGKTLKRSSNKLVCAKTSKCGSFKKS